MIATHTLGHRHAQRPTGSMEVVIEHLQAHQRIPGRIAFGKRMGFAGERVEPIPQRPIEPFDMHRPGWLHARAQRSPDLHRQEAPMRIAMLDALCSGEPLWDHQAGTSPLARAHRLARGSLQDVWIAVPPVTEPAERPLVGPLHGGLHRVCYQFLAQRTAGAGDHEAAVAVLDQAAPAFSFIRP
jgi:hypothetical protein